MKKKWIISFIVILASVLLVACNDNKGENENNSSNTENDVSEHNEEMNNSNEKDDSNMEMDHSSSGDVPNDLKEAEEPKYPVGNEAMIETDHMDGMKGAVGTIKGAYDTTAYVVTYTPENGGEKVENHKWVIHQEIKDAQEETYKEGDEVVLDADHMEGMEGATATIESSENTNVYMVTYEDTNTGEKVENHKWVTENELSPVD